MSEERNERITELAKEIAENSQSKGQKDSQSAFPQDRFKMALPPGLCEEAAKILFNFWEMNRAKSNRQPPLRWEQISPLHRRMWLEITYVVLDMSYTILLSDLRRFLDRSNGDLGAAFVRALERYAHDILNTRIK